MLEQGLVPGQLCSESCMLTQPFSLDHCSDPLPPPCSCRRFKALNPPLLPPAQNLSPTRCPLRRWHLPLLGPWCAAATCRSSEATPAAIPSGFVSPRPQPWRQLHQLSAAAVTAVVLCFVAAKLVMLACCWWWTWGRQSGAAHTSMLCNGQALLLLQQQHRPHRQRCAGSGRAHVAIAEYLITLLRL